MIARKIIVTLILLFSIPVVAQSNGSLTTHRLAPNFVLEDINGSTFELNEVIGKRVILLSFYASICKPCRDQLEAFSEIYNNFKENGLTLIAIATDDVKTVAKVKPYIKSMGYNFPVLYDTEGTVSNLYYAQLVPFSVLIDMKGYIVYSHMGYMRGDEMQLVTIIQKYLHE